MHKVLKQKYFYVPIALQEGLDQAITGPVSKNLQQGLGDADDLTRRLCTKLAPQKGAIQVKTLTDDSIGDPAMPRLNLLIATDHTVANIWLFKVPKMQGHDSLILCVPRSLDEAYLLSIKDADARAWFRQVLKSEMRNLKHDANFTDQNCKFTLSSSQHQALCLIWDKDDMKIALRVHLLDLSAIRQLNCH